jgi:thymidylate synthase (FAD)
MARECMEHAFSRYQILLGAGWPRELARSVLPVATYSQMFATVNLLNLLKFLTLRCDGHAQYEIRVYADAMRELVRPLVPVCIAAWEEKTKSDAA